MDQELPPPAPNETPEQTKARIRNFFRTRGIRYIKRHTHGRPDAVYTIVDPTCIELYFEDGHDPLTHVPYYFGTQTLQWGDIVYKDCCGTSRGNDLFVYFTWFRCVITGMRDVMRFAPQVYMGPHSVADAQIWTTPILTAGGGPPKHGPPAAPAPGAPRDLDQNFYSVDITRPDACFVLLMGPPRVFADERNTRDGAALARNSNNFYRLHDGDPSVPCRYVDAHTLAVPPGWAAAANGAPGGGALGGLNIPPLNGTSLASLLAHYDNGIWPPAPSAAAAAAGAPDPDPVAKWSKSAVAAYLFYVALRVYRPAAELVDGGFPVPAAMRADVEHATRRILLLTLALVADVAKDAPGSSRALVTGELANLGNSAAWVGAPVAPAGRRLIQTRPPKERLQSILPANRSNMVQMCLAAAEAVHTATEFGPDHIPAMLSPRDASWIAHMFRGVTSPPTAVPVPVAPQVPGDILIHPHTAGSAASTTPANGPIPNRYNRMMEVLIVFFGL